MLITTTKIAIAISLGIALIPQLASATSLSFSCSSNLVISLDNGYSASCGADALIAEDVLQNKTLSFVRPILKSEQLTLTSNIELQAGRDIKTSIILVEPKPTLNGLGGSILLNSNSGLILSGGVSNNALVTLVPEPYTYVMMILGLIPLGFMRKRHPN